MFHFSLWQRTNFCCNCCAVLSRWATRIEGEIRDIFSSWLSAYLLKKCSTPKTANASTRELSSMMVRVSQCLGRGYWNLFPNYVGLWYLYNSVLLVTYLSLVSTEQARYARKRALLSPRGGFLERELRRKRRDGGKYSPEKLCLLVSECVVHETPRTVESDENSLVSSHLHEQVALFRKKENDFFIYSRSCLSLEPHQRSLRSRWGSITGACTSIARTQNKSVLGVLRWAIVRGEAKSET